MSDVKWPRRAKNESSGVTWEQLEQGDDWVAVNPGPYTEIGDRRTGEFALQMLEEGCWTLVDHSQQPAPVAPFVPTWGPEWEYVDRGGRVLQFKRRLKFSVTPAIALTSTDEGDWNYNEDGSFWGARSPYHRDIVSQRPRTPAPVEPPAPSQPADVPAEPFVPTWNHESEYLDGDGNVFHLERISMTRPDHQVYLRESRFKAIFLFTMCGRFYKDSPSRCDIVSQRPRTPAPVEPPADAYLALHPADDGDAIDEAAVVALCCYVVYTNQAIRRDARQLASRILEGIDQGRTPIGTRRVIAKSGLSQL